jgi:ABC-type branched-subunit amino acid transport system permease subunit
MQRYFYRPRAIGVRAVAATGLDTRGSLYAAFVGALSLRTRGVYFIMVTLAFAQMVYFIVHDTPLGGGTDGIYLTMKPSSAPWTWTTR